MYQYIHDQETGGLLLTTASSIFSKEARPVYSSELVILGFNEFWNFEQQDDSPYMWAESNYYWYRGLKVAHISGGSLYEKPKITLEKDEKGNEILPAGTNLQPVDMQRMIEKNRMMMDVIEKATIKKIYDAWKRNINKVDSFRVAFSGGKDSIVLLELVKKALPKESFIVVFGDTGMEFPDTYETVNQVEEQCKEDGIAFYRAKSRFKPEESWNIFGPPSRLLRWCCSVHKSIPQTLKVREVLGKNSFSELVYVGVRAAESAQRSEYEYEMDGKKIKGQKSFNGILEWTSAEIWLYIYINHLIINHAYVLGNQRVGCIYCPMSLKTDFLKKFCYSQSMEVFEKIVRKHYSQEDLVNGYWCARSNGAQLCQNDPKIHSYQNEGTTVFEIKKPTTDIFEWLKTAKELTINYKIEKTNDGYVCSISKKTNDQKEISQIRLLTNLINKSAYCISCGACEANCKNGRLSFRNGLHIDNCLHCQECNHLENGCLLYKSLKYPALKEGNKMKTTIDNFGSHAPKTSWFVDFFKQPELFLKENSLGPEQKVRFKKFLRAASLIDAKGPTSFSSLIAKNGWKSELSLGLMLTNLAYNPQIKWYIKNLCIDSSYSRQQAVDMLVMQGCSIISSKFVISAFKRFCDLPFGTVLNFGYTTSSGKILETLTRTKSSLQDERVILYGLYKFAEACDHYHEFTLSRLMDFSVESNGVSPAEIFGFNSDEMEIFLLGLSNRYPEFISFITTHDLEVIRLNDGKTSSEVLELF